MKKILFGFLAATLICFNSCKKDDGGGNTDKTAILTSGKWQLTAQSTLTTKNAVAQPINDEYADLDGCERDDFMQLRSDKNIIMDEGASKCDPTDPQIYTVGTWSLLANDTKLRQSNVMVTIDWDIEQLDDNTLKISTTSSDVFGGDSYIYKSTSVFKHIN